MIEKSGYNFRLGEQTFLSSIAPSVHNWLWGQFNSYEMGTGAFSLGEKRQDPKSDHLFQVQILGMRGAISIP
jgi:hypothetical protein